MGQALVKQFGGLFTSARFFASMTRMQSPLQATSLSGGTPLGARIAAIVRTVHYETAELSQDALSASPVRDFPIRARGDLLPPTSSGAAAPAFLHEPPVQVIFSNSTGALVSCSASGQPRPTLGWTNESGSPLEQLAGLRRARPDGTLEFFPFRGEDYRQDVHATRYRCRASNALGAVFSRSVHVRAGE
ncbi:hypothetical protein HPB48_016616 [Haemaphysalis longicornis]|uniref:Ig-like domain-containing protein n=1 Tax=Haemaphysalis longicornis TaxID=44386 RepID=A0A9J6GEX2_HAELO|nr:hypothetical protein HPB48_016616 [Haemaphysalis longicornis]